MHHLASSQAFTSFISYLIYYNTASTAHICQTLRHSSEVVPERGEEEGWKMEDEVSRNKRLGVG
jgi:hypothetical protein